MGNSLKGEYMLKKENIRKIMGIGIISLFLLGCSENSFLLTEEESLEMKELVEGQGIVELPVTSEEKETIGEKEDIEAVNVSAIEEKETTGQDENMVREIVVHICGAVCNPGVFFLEEGQRVYHAIEMAGGLREDADGDYVNQALLLEDGMKIVIPTTEEVERMQGDFQALESAVDEKKSDKVNLNTADETMLCTLPGIGSSRAQSIIAYRTKNGAFKKIEDVMKVSGIKEAAFEKIKDFITVSN